MKKIKKNNVVVLKGDDYNGVELLNVIDWLNELGYDVVVKGGDDVVC